MATVLTDKQKRFRQIDEATKALIRTSLDKLANDVSESIYITQCELDSPNSMDFGQRVEEIGEIVQEFIIDYTENGDV